MQVISLTMRGDVAFASLAINLISFGVVVDDKKGAG